MICLIVLSGWLSPVFWGMSSLWVVRHNAPGAQEQGTARHATWVTSC